MTMTHRKKNSDLTSKPLVMEAKATISVVEAAAGEPQKRPTFDILAYSGGALNIAWFRYPVVTDLAGLRAGRVTILKDHDSRQIVGQGTATIADSTVTITGTITGDASAPDSPAGQVVGHAKNGFEWAASVGISIDRLETVDAGAKVTVNGKEFTGPLYVVRAGRLGETSFVAIGADETAYAKVAAEAAQTKQGATKMDGFEKWLKAKGFDADDLSEEGRERQQEQFKAESRETVNASASKPKSKIVDLSDAIVEGRRRKAIEKQAFEAAAAAGYDVDYTERVQLMAAKAIENGQTPEQFEMELLKGGMPEAPFSGIGINIAEPQNSPRVMAAAALLSSGCTPEEVSASFGAREVDAAQKRYGSNLTLHELILAAANGNGYPSARRSITMGNYSEVMRHALAPMRTVRAGFSTVDLTGILGNVANKAMAKVAAEPQWNAERVCGIASHANFHEHTVYSLAANGDIALVAPTGELKDLDLGQESYTRKIQTRGARLRLSRQDIINDDMGAFTRLSRDLARKSYNAREKTVFTKIMVSADGASHFTAARGNYSSGSGSAFSIAGMNAAIAKFRSLTGPDGDPVGVEPQLLIVPPTLEAEARAVLAPASQVIMAGLASTSAGSKTANTNIYAGRFGGGPVVSHWLENSNITGNSTAYWYLLADPGTLPCFELSYLNGNRVPTVDYFGLDSESDTLGVTWRVYWDFGVDNAEWRAGVKSKGS